MERRNGRNNAETQRVRGGERGERKKEEERREKTGKMKHSVKIAKRVRRASNVVISLKFGEQRAASAKTHT